MGHQQSRGPVAATPAMAAQDPVFCETSRAGCSRMAKPGCIGRLEGDTEKLEEWYKSETKQSEMTHLGKYIEAVKEFRM